MNDFPWLSLVLLLPILGGVIVAFLPRVPGSALPKQVALGVSLLTLLVALGIAVGFSPKGEAKQFTELHTWIGAFGRTTRWAWTASAWSCCCLPRSSLRW